MVIFIIEHVTPSVRGELSRWFIEPHAGIFVGNISAMVREKLWEYLQKKSPNCAITLLHNAKTEQGFTIRTYGDTTRKVVDFEGISLIKKIENNQTKK